MTREHIPCRECGEPTVYKRADGIWVCGACGHMFEGKPKPLPATVKGNWKAEKK